MIFSVESGRNSADISRFVRAQNFLHVESVNFDSVGRDSIPTISIGGSLSNKVVLAEFGSYPYLKFSGEFYIEDHIQSKRHVFEESRIRLRDIPPLGGHYGDPYFYRPESTKDLPPMRLFSSAQDVKECFYELGLPSGEKFPIFFLRGDGSFVFNFNLVELLRSRSVLPALPAAYFDFKDRFDIECLFDLIKNAFVKISYFLPLVEVNALPGDARTNINVRFDYDRPVSHEGICSIVESLRVLGISSSWYFLNKNLASESIPFLRRSGCEVGLHSEASDLSEFLLEDKQIFGNFPPKFRGATFHGGRGSCGFLGGATAKAWALHVGHAYYENLGGLKKIPIFDDDSNAGAIVGMPPHISFDTSMRDDGHNLHSLLTRINQPDAFKGMASIMSHPDIHQEQLLEFLSAFRSSFSDPWCSYSNAIICEWIIATRRSRALAIENGELVWRVDTFKGCEKPPPSPKITTKKGVEQIDLEDAKQYYKAIGNLHD
jgi:hypothetical protein